MASSHLRGDQAHMQERRSSFQDGVELGAATARTLSLRQGLQTFSKFLSDRPLTRN